MPDSIPAFISAGATYNVSAGQIYTGVVEGALIVLSGGRDLDTTFSAGGVEIVDGAGCLDSGVVIDSGAYDYVYVGGLEYGATINSGGTLILEGGTAIDTLVDGGFVMEQGVEVSATTIENGGVVEIDDVALDTQIDSGGTLELIANGTASGVSATSGGTFELTGVSAYAGFVVSAGVALVVSGGTAIGSIVESGGRDEVYGGLDSQTNLFGGGEQIVSGGQAFGALVNSGASQIVDGGSTDSTTIESGGLELVNSGAASNTTISGGELDVSSGGSLYGSILFVGSGGTLRLADPDVPYAVISGFSAGDTIDLAGVPYDSAGGYSILESQNVIQVVEGGTAYDVSLDPTETFSGGIVLSDDGQGGTDIVAKSGAVTGYSTAPTSAGSSPANPYGAVCYISADGFRGTGFIIGPHTILTAAHVVIDENTGQIASNILVYPGDQSGDNGVSLQGVNQSDVNYISAGLFGYGYNPQESPHFSRLEKARI